MRILLSRTDRIGDLILSTPAIASVRASFPQAHLTLVTSPYNRVVVERNTDLDELVELPRAVRPQIFGAARRDYDVAIALAPRAVDLQLVGATRARLRVGYTYERRWFARLSAPFFVNGLMISEADPQLCERDPHRAVRHEVVQLLDLVALAGAKQRVTALRLDLREEDHVAAAGQPPDAVVLHLGQRWFREGSTLESTLQLVDEIAARAPVVITCAAECAEVAPRFASRPGVWRLHRDLPFHQWAAVFAAARVVVTVDTGATHVASAVRRPAVVAFEHRYFRLNSQEWAPYGVPHVLVRKPESENDAALASFRAQIVRGLEELLHG